MQDLGQSFALAMRLILDFDADLFEIITLSLHISLIATAIACVSGMMFGAFVAVKDFPGRSAVIVLMNSLMSLPPVVVGLIVYLSLSRAGPFGWLGLLYSPSAMIIAQVLLITPIIAALSRQLLEDLYQEYREQFDSFALSSMATVRAILWDGRYSLITVALAGFGRSVSEVGAVIIVGGNIEHFTRVMTTAIALETSKGNLDMALALGIILLLLSLLVNAMVSTLRLSATRLGYA